MGVFFQSLLFFHHCLRTEKRRMNKSRAAARSYTGGETDLLISRYSCEKFSLMVVSLQLTEDLDPKI